MVVCFQIEFVCCYPLSGWNEENWHQTFGSEKQTTKMLFLTCSSMFPMDPPQNLHFNINSLLAVIVSALLMICKTVCSGAQFSTSPNQIVFIKSPSWACQREDYRQHNHCKLWQTFWQSSTAFGILISFVKMKGSPKSSSCVQFLN